MSAAAVAIVAVLGAVFGRTVVVRAVSTIPERWDPPAAAQGAIAVANALLWAFVTNEFTKWWVVIAYLVVMSALVAVSVVDLRLYRIPDRIVFPSLLATVVLLVVASISLHAGDRVRFGLAGLAIYFGILFLFHLVYPKGMGFGDVKLALLMGFALGWLADSYFSAMYLVLVALFIGCILGIVFGLAWRVVQRRGGAFPFGPALAVAVVYVILTFDRYLVVT